MARIRKTRKNKIKIMNKIAIGAVSASLIVFTYQGVSFINDVFDTSIYSSSYAIAGGNAVGPDEYRTQISTSGVVVQGAGTVECQQGYEDQVVEELKATVAYPVEGCEEYQGYITEWTDLMCRETINVSELNYIIDYWVKKNGTNYSLYSGNGQAFIDVSKRCGYDPLFLMSLACNESGWNVSNLHASKNNPYSINMIDTYPDAGYVLGDTYYDGIVNGGIWIYDHYYKKGCTNLHDMIYKGHYASAKDKWINSIVKTMNKSYEILMELKKENK